MNPHTGRDFVQFGKTESVLNKGAEKIAPLFNPPPVLSLEITYNNNYISIFQNAGNSLPFPYKLCATTENILICIIISSNTLYSPSYVPLRCLMNICSNPPMLISFAGSQENTSKTVILSLFTYIFSPRFPNLPENWGCPPCLVRLWLIGDVQP